LGLFFSALTLYLNVFISAKYYAKIKEETKLMQDKIISELGLSPIEKEVVVVYQGEAKEQPDDFFQVIML